MDNTYNVKVFLGTEMQALFSQTVISPEHTTKLSRVYCSSR